MGCRDESERNTGGGRDLGETRSVRKSQPHDENSMGNVPGSGNPT